MADDPGAGHFLLAFDTSGPVGSVAVALDEDVLARASMDRRGGHASELIPTIEYVLEEAGVDRDELGSIVVGEGPGSFTGVRVAAATAKGLGHALDLPVFAVSSLAAAALTVDGQGVRYALFDARAERVYCACYAVGSRTVEELAAPHGGELRDVLDGDVPAGASFVGDGATRHRAVIEGAGYRVLDGGTDRTLADGLVRYLALAPLPPLADLAAWEPEYVRASSAERLWRT